MWRIVLALAFGGLCGSFAVAGEPVRLRVLSYNIHHAEGTDGALDIQRIARVINGVEPDLVALQEVDTRTARTERVDQGAELARLTALTLVRGSNIDFQGGRYGNAALVRGEVIEHENHSLPPSSAEQRGVLDVVVGSNGGSEKIRFLVTHLDHRPDDGERLASAAFINGLVEDSAMPALLAGDLNDTPKSATLKRFGRQWSNPTRDAALPTAPSSAPRRQIDYVLCRPAGGWKLVEARVLEEAVASDHRGILVVLERVE